MRFVSTAVTLLLHLSVGYSTILTFLHFVCMFGSFICARESLFLWTNGVNLGHLVHEGYFRVVFTGHLETLQSLRVAKGSTTYNMLGSKHGVQKPEAGVKMSFSSSSCFFYFFNRVPSVAGEQLVGLTLAATCTLTVPFDSTSPP